MPSACLLILCLGIIAWLAFAAFCSAMLRRTPREDIPGSLLWALASVYVRVVHRVRYENLDLVPRTRNAGPLVVIANHTAGIDPLLIQAACPFFIRWMMLREMMPTWGGLSALWELTEVIPVGKDGQDAQAARIAIRHLKDHGIVGVFPEGGIERPARIMLPFEPGVGLLVSRAKARVLLAVIDGTPDVANAYQSLICPSRSRVRFIALIDYAAANLGAAEIAADLQSRTQRALGWPVAAASASPDAP